MQGRKKPARVWLSTGQVARRCGVSVRTVSKWIDRGLLRGYKLPGCGHRRVYPRDLRVFMLAHGMLQEAPAGTPKTQLTLDFPDDRPPADPPRSPPPVRRGRGYRSMLRRNGWAYDRLAGFPVLAASDQPQ